MFTHLEKFCLSVFIIIKQIICNSSTLFNITLRQFICFVKCFINIFCDIKYMK